MAARILRPERSDHRSRDRLFLLLMPSGQWSGPKMARLGMLSSTGMTVAGIEFCASSLKRQRKLGSTTRDPSLVIESKTPGLASVHRGSYPPCRIEWVPRVEA
jgi:hypothetical protein